MIYLDTSIKLRSNGLEPIAQALDQVGILTKYHNSYITCYSDPRSFDWFGEDMSTFDAVHSLEANLLGMRAGHFITALVMKAWVICALDADCIAPPGSYRYGTVKNWIYGCTETSCGCHRYDQHALTVINTYFFGYPVEFDTKPACVITDAESDFFYDVRRRPTHILWVDQIKYLLLIVKSFLF